ncbi:MAG: DUF3795 domain-containing protein [Promethearchaeota archaeon]
MSLKLEDVREEDRGILSPCGILCLGCDIHLGEGVEAAKQLKKIWEGWNMEDLGPLLGLRLKGIQSTLKTLNKYIDMNERGNCPGCSQGAPMANACGIALCAKSKGYWTCAECEDYNPDSDSPCPHSKEGVVPTSDSSKMMKIICTRYSGNTIENLKRCQEIGYSAFIKEAQEKVKNGWRTWQIISSDMVFTEATKK